ncbi:hypothetical protein G6F71_000100 [Rhizopus microsporus]|nr:hypothetical protein G6F71_000100 [Rhizopus microsporus]
MHPNSHLHQYIQQSSLANAAAAAAVNPLSASLPNNALSQHFPAMRSTNGANADPYVFAQMLGNPSQAMPLYNIQQQQQEAAAAAHAHAHAAAQQQQHKLAHLDEEKIYGLVLELLNPSTREQALLDLSKKREQFEDLALVLWYSYGVIPVLLQEIITVYPLLNPPTLSGGASNRVCNALALLQCVANHNETRSLFLQAHIPLYLYPFLNTTSKTRPFEYLRLTSLGVIGALVKNDNPEVISFLLSTEIIPLCLRIMESGSELSKTVAIFVVQKILLDETGLYYICQTAREALRQCLPEPLRDSTFHQALKDDIATKRCLAQLLLNLSDGIN